MLGLIALAFVQTQDPAANPAYMQIGNYYAASSREDPQALGGFGVAGKPPMPVDKAWSRDSLNAQLLENKVGLILRLSNGSKQGVWISAADSNILGYLEAKNSDGNWKPIEYKPWYTCGNSYHRLHLPVGEGWEFLIHYPRGEFYTSVRWKYYGSDKPMYSNEVQCLIPSTKFQLSPADSARSEITTEWGPPTLVPKR